MFCISCVKEMGEIKGFVKLLVDVEIDFILGVFILGVGGDEIINMFVVIMYSEIECWNYCWVVLVYLIVFELMFWILDGIKEVRVED